MTTEELDKKTKSLDSLLKSSEDKERELTREVSLLENKVAKFDSELTDKMIIIDSMTSKAQQYDLVRNFLKYSR